MKTTIVSESLVVPGRLAALGIDQAILVDAVRAGCIARGSCTELDPRMYPGTTMWGVTVRHLRLGLTPLGWDFSESRNYSRTISPDKKLEIVVATGDEATGLVKETPATQSRKGPRTAEVVAANARQLHLPFEWPEVLPETVTARDVVTWLLLIHSTESMVRAELSRPVSCDESLRVSGWHERIILPSVSADPGDSLVFDADESPEIDVEVRRRV